MTDNPVPLRSLGPSGLVVSSLGLGCLPMSGSYGEADEESGIATIRRAIDLGVFLLDTAALYGWGHNEGLVGRAIAGRRDEIVLSSKFGRWRADDGSKPLDARPEVVGPSCEESMKRLGVDYIDLYYLHRVDPKVPIEETVGAMGELVAAGKIGHLGLCEVTSETIERAVATFPITALQSEWSLWAREIEQDVIPTARRLGVGIVPFSPLGRGFLTGTMTAPGGFGPSDPRRDLERYQGEFFEHNREILVALCGLAGECGITPAQLALAWLLAQGDDVVPIPGSQKIAYLEENAAASSIRLDKDVLDRIGEIVPVGVWSGSIFPGGRATRVYGSTPALPGDRG